MAQPAKRSGHRWFVMPPAETPEAPEQKQFVDVYAVLRDHVAYAAAIRAEVRQSRREQQELAMKVSELSSKVDTLISTATDIKSRAESAGPGGGAVSVGTPPTAEDDPEVQRLADRIDEAVRVLKGEKSAGSSQLDSMKPELDPNAPVAPPTPVDAVGASDPTALNPAGLERDPNAPVT